MITALLLAVAAPATAGEVFDLMEDRHRVMVHAICADNLDAFIAGDKNKLERVFTQENIPMQMRMVVTKLCITYGAGVLKGMELVKR